ncbi:hypothetical protein [Streptomyces sp. NPDC049970]|uniref:hypothetical protein n=1 Tax=Streptomyces sp. NPDC049970 TaxID=3155033 RepID=UPI0034321838
MTSLALPARAGALSPLIAAWPNPQGRTWETRDHEPTVDRSPLPAFSEPASDAPVPAQAGGRRLMPVEQGADFRRPPGEPEPAPAPARRPLAPGDLTFAAPDRHI